MVWMGRGKERFLRGVVRKGFYTDFSEHKVLNLRLELIVSPCAFVHCSASCAIRWQNAIVNYFASFDHRMRSFRFLLRRAPLSCSMCIEVFHLWP